MKVSLEGTTEELIDLAELLALGRTSRRANGPSKADYRAIRARNDVPDRFREEGV